jgi:hypothetical protein
MGRRVTFLTWSQAATTRKSKTTEKLNPKPGIKGVYVGVVAVRKSLVSSEHLFVLSMIQPSLGCRCNMAASSLLLK